MTVLLVLFLLVALFLAGMPLLARLGWQPFGPLYQHELLRLGRRNSLTLWRAGLVGTQLLMMFLNYLFTFPGIPLSMLLFGSGDFIDPTASQQFAEAFLWKFLWVQQIAAIILTPIYLGGAIAEEKERKAWDFLLTSQLSSWELITGKFTARLTYVLSILASGLPVLLLTLLFGGVNPERVLQGFLISGVTVVSLGVVSLWVGVHRPRLRDVLLWVFAGLVFFVGWVLVGMCWTHQVMTLHPATVLFALELADAEYTRFDAWSVSSFYTTVLLSIAFGFLYLSFLQVRKPQKTEKQKEPSLTLPTREAPSLTLPAPMEPDPAPTEPEMPEWYAIRVREVALGDRTEYALGRRKFVPHITDDDNPLDWKERHFASQVSWLESKWLRSTLLLVISFVSFLVCAGWFVASAFFLMEPGYRNLEGLRTMGAVTALVVLCVVPYLGLRTSMSIAEERSNQTLVELLMLPGDRSAILWAKMKAPCKVMILPLLVLLIGVIVVAISSVQAVLTSALFVGYVASFCAFSLLLGLYFSTRIQSAIKSALLYLGVMLVLYLGPPLIVGFSLSSAFAGASPLYTGAVFVKHIAEMKETGRVFELMLACYSLVYNSAAIVLGLAAKNRFEKEGQT
jgi:ABC-type transport system involved in multi-copper enzyme maturation permease subunit